MNKKRLMEALGVGSDGLSTDDELIIHAFDKLAVENAKLKAALRKAVVILDEYAPGFEILIKEIDALLSPTASGAGGDGVGDEL